MKRIKRIANRFIVKLAAGQELGPQLLAPTPDDSEAKPPSGPLGRIRSDLPGFGDLEGEPTSKDTKKVVSEQPDSSSFAAAASAAIKQEISSLDTIPDIVALTINGRDAGMWLYEKSVDTYRIMSSDTIVPIDVPFGKFKLESIAKTIWLGQKFAAQFEEDDLEPDTIRDPEPFEEEPPSSKEPLTQRPYTIPAGQDPAQYEYGQKIPGPPRLPTFDGPMSSQVDSYATALKSVDEDTIGRFLGEKFGPHQGDLLHVSVDGNSFGIFKREEGPFVQAPFRATVSREKESVFERVIGPTKNVEVTSNEFMDWLGENKPILRNNILSIVKEHEAGTYKE